MTTKTDFNAEQWSAIVEGPPLAGMIVIAAERGGTLRESIEMSRAYTDARQGQPGGELIDELLKSPPSIDPARYSSPEELRSNGFARLREAVGALEGTADTEEIDSYRGFVLAVAERVAHAHKSGGFLGVGGQEVSDAEQAALDEVREAIGAHPV